MIFDYFRRRKAAKEAAALLDTLTGRGIKPYSVSPWFTGVKNEIDASYSAALKEHPFLQQKSRDFSRKMLYSLAIWQAMNETQMNLHPEGRATPRKCLQTLLKSHCSTPWYRDRSQGDTSNILEFMQGMGELVASSSRPGNSTGVCAARVTAAYFLVTEGIPKEQLTPLVPDVSRITYLALQGAYRWWVERDLLGSHAQAPLPFASSATLAEYVNRLATKTPAGQVERLNAVKSGVVVQQIGDQHPVEIWRLESSSGTHASQLFLDPCSIFDYRATPPGMELLPI